MTPRMTSSEDEPAVAEPESVLEPTIAYEDDAAPQESAARASERGRTSASPEVRDIMRWTQGDLHQAWYAACQSKELKAGKPRSVMIMEEPIVLFRDGSGAPRALIDRCLHRNAPLSEGRVTKDGCISCPYHGWTYDGDGTCVRVPSEGPNTSPASRRAAEAFPTVEDAGLVWVWLGDPERAKDVEPFHVPVGEGPGWNHYYMYTDFAGDVTDLVENFMDVPHTAFVHAGWFRNESKHVPTRSEADVVRTHDAVHVNYHSEDDDIGGFIARLVNPDRQPLVHTDRFYMPNSTRVDYAWSARRHFIITSTITPVTPEKAMVFTSIAYRFGILAPLARLLLPWYTRKVIMQDVDIMEHQTRTLGQFKRRRFFSTEADAIHRAVEILRDHRLRGGDGPTPKRLEKRITFWM